VPTDDFTLFSCLLVHDASAKMPSGLLNGNVHAMGDFYQCLRVSQKNDGPVDRGGGLIRGKYCQVNTYINVDQPKMVAPSVNQIIDSLLSYRAIQSNYYDVSNTYLWN